MEVSSGLAAGPEVSPGTFLSGHAGELHQVWTALGGCGMQSAEEFLYLYTVHLYICIQLLLFLRGYHVIWPLFWATSLVFSCSFSLTGLAIIVPYSVFTVKDCHLTCPVSLCTCWAVLPGLW